jgi:hypothetical protein
MSRPTARRRMWQVVVTDTLRHRSILPKADCQTKVLKRGSQPRDDGRW